MNVQYVIVACDVSGNWSSGSAPDFEGTVWKSPALPRIGEELELHDERRARVVRILHRLFGYNMEESARAHAEELGEDLPPNWSDLKHVDVLVGITPLEP